MSMTDTNVIVTEYLAEFRAESSRWRAMEAAGVFDPAQVCNDDWYAL